MREWGLKRYISPPFWDGGSTMLWRLLGFAGLLAVLIALVPADAHAQKKKKGRKGGTPKSTAEMATAADYAYLAKQTKINGEIVSVDPSSMTVTLRIEFPHTERNPNFNPSRAGQGNRQLMQQYNQLNRLQMQIMRERNPFRRQQEMQRLMVQMQRLQMTQARSTKGDPKNQPFRVVTTKKDYELPLTEKIVTRKTFMPFEYDDMGNVKKYSPAELAKLKGKDSSKPGYESKLDEIVPGMGATLYLRAATKSSGSTKRNPDDPPPPAVSDTDGRPSVTMIVLTKDSSPFATFEAPGKRKGKK